jgi:hypothetical protein
VRTARAAGRECDRQSAARSSCVPLLVYCGLRIGWRVARVICTRPEHVLQCCHAPLQSPPVCALGCTCCAARQFADGSEGTVGVCPYLDTTCNHVGVADMVRYASKPVPSRYKTNFVCRGSIASSAFGLLLQAALPLGAVSAAEPALHAALLRYQGWCSFRSWPIVPPFSTAVWRYTAE